MPILPDDPRLTAYALGELDEQEREQIEAELPDSPQRQRAVAEIREMADRLRHEFAAEALPEVDEKRLVRIITATVGAAVVGAAAAGVTTMVDGQPIASVATQQANHEDWAGSPLAARLSTIDSPRRRFVALVSAACLLIAVGSVLALSASRRGPELANLPAAYWQNDDVQHSTRQKAYTASNPVPKAAEGQPASRLLGLVDQSKSVSAKDPNYTTGNPVWETKEKSKEMGYTVAKPVYETKTKTIEYTVNGKTMRREVPYTVNRGTLPGQQGRFGSGEGRFGPRGGIGGLLSRAKGVRVPPDAGYFDLPPKGYLAVEARSLAQQELAEAQRAETEHNTEAYARIVENAFLSVTENPLSTFSIDVDTASYANMRRFLNQGMLPPPDAVRIEELLNYFTYDYAPPTDDKPFAVHSEVAACPWNGEHRLVRIGIKGKEIETDKRPASNLVFLIDVSGSMDRENKLPLLKSGLKLLVDKLGENDRVAIVVYAGASGLVLDSITGDQKESITASIEQLQPGGSTNGASGIELAYERAVKHFIKGGTNRVILCTDGDFNVGVTNEGDLTRLIEDKAKSGVFLSVLGFGDGNLKDATMEKLADKGNGNYGYIDTINEARKTLVEQMSGTLVTIAKDVKIQIEFNPAQVAAYRLIGYENRMLAKEDFNDDTKDAGEIGAGHTVTALYEIVPAGKPAETPKVDELKYQQLGKLSDAAASGDLLTLKLRYKAPEGSQSTPLEFPLKDSGADFGKASGDFKFASAVASFGMLLRQSQHKGSLTLDGVLEIAQSSKGDDKTGYRGEFIELVKKAKQIGGK